MNITPTKILDTNRNFNNDIHTLKNAVRDRITSAHHSMRTQAPSAQHFARVGEAVALNGMWGLKAGVEYSDVVAMTLGVPRLVFGAHALRMPTGMGFSLGVGGIAYLGGLVAGSHKPMTPDVACDPQKVRLHRLDANGIAGTFTKALERQAQKCTMQNRPKLAQACLWSAAILAVAASVVRLGMHALHIAMAIGVGVVSALVCGTLAGLVQLPDHERVDVLDLAKELERARPELAR